MPRRVHNGGERGRLVAEAEGRGLAVLHQTFGGGAHGCRAPMPPEQPGRKRSEAPVRALREQDTVVVQRDCDPVTLARDGHVGVFRFTGLRVDTAAGDLSLTLTERHADPK